MCCWHWLYWESLNSQVPTLPTHLTFILIMDVQVFAQHRVLWSVLEESSSVLTSRSLLGKLGRFVGDEAENKTTQSWAAVIPGLALLMPQLLLIFQCRYSSWLPKDSSPQRIPAWGWGAVFSFHSVWAEQFRRSPNSVFLTPCFHTAKLLMVLFTVSLDSRHTPNNVLSNRCSLC